MSLFSFFCLFIANDMKRGVVCLVLVCLLLYGSARAVLLPVGSSSWGARYGHISIFAGETMYVLGGKFQSGSTAQDVWTSSVYPYNTGVLLGSNVLPSPCAFAGAHYSNRTKSITVLGGNDGTQSLDGVWTSQNGSSWTTHGGAAWGPRERFGVLLSNETDTIYLFGGLTTIPSQIAYNDMWRSVDGGVTWTLHLASTSVPARYGFASASDGTSMYVMGGTDLSNNVYSDVWRASAADGYTIWQSVATAGPPAQRTGAGAFIANDMVHVLSGTYGTVNRAVNSHVQSRTRWNGRMWCMPDDSNPLFPTAIVPSYYGLAVRNDSIAFINGGFNGSIALDGAYVFNSSDLTCNPNQTQWMNISSFANTFGGRYLHSSAYINQVLYVFGGIGASGAVLNQVLKYTYVYGWETVTHDGSVFPPLNGHATVTHVPSGCAYLWGGLTGVSQNKAMFRFCGNNESFSVVVNDTGFGDTRFGYTIVESRIFMIGLQNARYSDYPFTTWVRAPFITGLSLTQYGSLASVNGMLVYLNGNLSPFILRGVMWNITIAAFVANNGTWTRTDLPFGRRESFVGATLNSVDTSRSVPFVTSASVNQSFFDAGGQTFNTMSPNSYLLTNNVWTASNSYPLTVKTSGTSWIELLSPGVATPPNLQSVTSTGGRLSSFVASGDMFIYGANACLSDPCNCGGTCVLAGSNTNYTCECPQGTSGARCESNKCTIPPCQNGGSCVDACGDSYCVCPIGFTGENCENSPVASSSSSTGDAAPSVSSSTGTPTALNYSSSSSTGNNIPFSSTGVANHTRVSSSTGEAETPELESSAQNSLTLASTLISVGVSVSVTCTFFLFLFIIP